MLAGGRRSAIERLARDAILSPTRPLRLLLHFSVYNPAFIIAFPACRR
jgi:hypothetical protein